jgi:hypothetical protein
MGAGGLLFVTAVVAGGWRIINLKPDRKARAPRSTSMTARELCGLVDVEFTENLTLVSPRGVELPYSPDWDIDAVIDYLVEVDAL